MTSGLFTVDFSDFAIAIPRGIDASGRRVRCGPDFAGEKLAYAYFEEEPGQRSAAKLLTKGEVGRIAANVAKLPEQLLSRRQTWGVR